MKILVTGFLGFIGGQLYNQLKDEHLVSGYEYYQDFPDIRGYDWVIHAGAISSTTETDVEKILRQNLDFSQLLLAECDRHGVNLQYSSTASIYGMGRDFRETAPPDPRTPYSWSKYLFERHVRNTPVDIHVQGFRYFNVYSDLPYEAHKGGQASPHYQFRQQAKLHKRIRLFTGSEGYFRDFVPVDHVVDIHRKFLTIPESGLWNVGTGQVRSFADIAQDVGNETDCEFDYIPMPENLKASYQTYTRADLTHLHNTLEKYNGMGR